MSAICVFPQSTPSVVLSLVYTFGVSFLFSQRRQKEGEETDQRNDTKNKKIEVMVSHRVAKGTRGLCTASSFFLPCVCIFCRPVCWRHSAFTQTSSSTQGTWTFVIVVGASQNATKFQPTFVSRRWNFWLQPHDVEMTIVLAQLTINFAPTGNWLGPIVLQHFCLAAVKHCSCGRAFEGSG